MLKAKGFYSNKKVIVRVDYNVPVVDGVIQDDRRISSSLDTINYLKDSNAKIILMSHFGKIKTQEDKKNNSLIVVKESLENLLNDKIYFCDQTRGEKLEEMVEALKPGEILLVENTRFEDYPNKLESACDAELSSYWASLVDEFVMDAFGAMHRSHASTYGVASILGGVTGFLVDGELKKLNEALLDNNKTLILGGAKVDDKLGFIENLIDKSKKILLGGGMCFTFLKSNGCNIGKSLCSDDYLSKAKDLLSRYKEKLILPIDVKTDNGVKMVNEISNGDTAYDIGPQTINYYKSLISGDDFIVWNGPLGMFENTDYETGTKKTMEYLNKNNIKTIICGGDTANAALKYDLNFYYISSGGGAALEYLEGKEFEILGLLNN